MIKHKKAFYIGSILPDCTPSFLARKHTKEETFPILIKELKKVTVDYDINKGISTYFCRHLGIISHYLADYCTFPHNSSFDGTLKEHCAYESELKFKLKEYVNEKAVQKKIPTKKPVLSLDEIIHLIETIHNEYLKAVKIVKEDCKYIVELCYQVTEAILQYFKHCFEQEVLSRTDMLSVG